MKKTIGLISTLVLSTLMFTGCQNMSASDQRIGAAALGGAVGGGVGNHVGGGLGAGVGAAAGAGVGAVSYTHLRAHETRGNLVCRLLLEKNFFNDTATTEIYTRKIVGSVRCV